MAKGGTIQYEIKFDVNKSSLNEIRSQLLSIQQLTTKEFSKKSGLPLEDAKKQLSEIRQSAIDLQKVLDSAFNVKMGTVNLTKFREELNKLDTGRLINNLNMAGIQGTQAFRNVTAEVLTMNNGFRQSNRLLDSIGTTFKNTIKWGLSSAVFNGVTRAISDAWTYSKNLDSSLNAIRRVSNATADDMERFAKYANQSAQTMGKSTLDYTKGALIYYQQGLNEEEVKKRTDITMKMSNVLGASAEDVSNYMTAIWNNFAKGSEELEHFADVLTKLGAETASSAEEISTGLEKFAAIGNTVGLSYEYAAAALATVTATTRQSADTVGTAFKTLFARIQDLDLGNTLDDGTTLGKYSEALQVIGVHIRDTNGNLKSMDTILDDMGSKWQSLTNAQKVATAQTVAGVRQYSQLMALMDNWDYFKENVERANNATGELQRQQDIYMQSTQAHLESLGAAVEKIKASFIDNKGINTLIDSLTLIVNKFGDLINAIGGGGNALLLLGSIATKVFGRTLADSIGTSIANIKQMKKEAKINDVQQSLVEDFTKNKTDMSDEATSDMVTMKKGYLDNRSVATEEDRDYINDLILQRNELGKTKEAWEESTQSAQEYVDVLIQASGIKIDESKIKGLTKESASYGEIANLLETSFNKYDNLSKDVFSEYTNNWKKYTKNKSDVTKKALEESLKDYEAAAQDIIDGGLVNDKLTEKLSQSVNELPGLTNLDSPEVKAKIDNFVELVKSASLEVKNNIEQTSDTVAQEVNGKTQEIENNINNVNNSFKAKLEKLDLKKSIKNITDLAAGVGQLAVGINSLTHLSDIWNDKDLSSGEKAVQIIMAFVTAVPLIVSGISAIGTALNLSFPVVLAIMAAIAAITVTISTLVQHADTAENRLKRAEQAAESAKKELEELESAAEELQNSISKYEELEKTFSNLTKGTDEWKQAILEANELVLDLLDKYPQLLDYIYTSEEGLLKIKSEGFDELQKQQQQQIMQQRLYVTSANRSVVAAEKDVEIENFKSNINPINPFAQAIISNESVEKLGNFVSNNMETVLKGSNEDIIKALENSSISPEEYGYTNVDDFINGLKDNTGEISRFNKSMSTYDTKLSGYTDAILTAIGNDNKDYQNTENKPLVNNVLDDKYEAYYKKEKERLENADYETWASEYMNEISEKRKGKSYVTNRAAEWGLLDTESWIWDADSYGGASKEDRVYKSQAIEKLATKYAKEYIENELPNAIKDVDNYIAGFNKSSGAYANLGTFLRQVSSGEDVTKLYSQEELANYYSKFQAFKDVNLKDSNSIRKFDDVFNMSPNEFIDKIGKAVQEGKTQAEVDQYKAQDFRSKADAKAEEIGVDKSGFAEYTDNLIKNSKALKENDEFAIKAAASHYKLAQKLDALNTSLTDNKDVLNKWKAGKALDPNEMEKVGQSITKVKEALGENVTEDFVKEHLEEIRKLAAGDVSVLDDLEKQLAEDYILGLRADWKEEPTEKVQEFVNYIDGLNIEDIEVGANMNLDVANQLQTFIDNLGITEAEANRILSQIGYDPSIDTVTGNLVDQNEETATYEYTDPTTGKTRRYTNKATANVQGTIQIPVINAGKTKFVGANKNNFKYTPSNKNKGNGKKSGGGSSSKPKTLDKIDDEADRYHKVNTQISKIDNQLKKVQSQQQKLVGAKLIENLTKQWQLLNTQIQNYNEKLKIAQGEQSELAKKLAKQGVQFNADGTIANYMEAFQAQENYVNGLIAQYNKLSKKQQETWDNNKTIDKAKENFNKFKENMDRYDTLVASEIPGLEQSIQDAIDKQIEINVEKFNLRLTVILDMNQATRDWNAWKKKVIDGIKKDDILGNARARAEDFSTYFNKKGNGDIQAGTEQVNKILAELDQMDQTGKSSVYGDDRQKALDELKEKYTALMESMTQELELEEELYQDILDEMDKVQEKFDEQIESYKYLHGLLEHDIKVVQLVYGEKAYKAIANLEREQLKYIQEQMDMSKKAEEFWYAQMQAAQENSEEWEKAKQNWLDATEETQSYFVEATEKSLNILGDTINGIMQDLSNTITNGLGLDYVNEQWELINKNADRYLDTVNATYGIRSLEKKYTDAINKSNNLNAQQKLKKIMDEQLEDLKQKDRLTQYDLDRANKLYDIELARLALEEAQMNKSQMRLRRDSQGNYTYQYVANNDKIAEAEQRIEDLYNQLYNFDKERYNQVLNDAYAAWDEYQQKMAEAAMINDPQERAERELLIQTEYDELMTQIEQDYQIARYTLQESLFTSLAILTADSLDNSTNQYGIALADAEGKTKIAFNDISNTVSEAFDGADRISNETFQKIATAAEAAMNQVDGYTGKSFQAIKDGFDSLTAYEKNILATQFIPTWDNGVSQMVQHFIYGKDGGMKAIEDTFAGKISSMKTLFVGADGKSGFVGATKTGWEQIHKAEQDYQKDLGNNETIAKRTYASIKDGINTNIDRVKTFIKTNEDVLTQYSKELKAVQDVYKDVEKLKKMFDSQAQSAKTAAQEAYNYYVKQKELQEQEIKNTPKTTTTNTNTNTNTNINTNTNTNNNTNNTPKTGSGNGKLEVDDEVTFTTDKNARWAKDEGNGTKIASWVFGNKFYVGTISGSTVRIKDPHGPNNTAKGWTGWIDKKWLSGYDTGGYTGSWDSSGRLAMLHQKELVLNAKDTENMLNTVAIMRGLTYSLGSTMLSRLAGATASGYSGGSSGSDGILEQNVHIDATFPNVKNATEIEEALNNLVNAASQRAYERR